MAAIQTAIGLIDADQLKDLLRAGVYLSVDRYPGAEPLRRFLAGQTTEQAN